MPETAPTAAPAPPQETVNGYFDATTPGNKEQLGVEPEPEAPMAQMAKEAPAPAAGEIDELQSSVRSRAKPRATTSSTRPGSAAPLPQTSNAEKNYAPRRALTKKDFSEMQSAKNADAQTTQQEVDEANKAAQLKTIEAIEAKKKESTTAETAKLRDIAVADKALEEATPSTPAAPQPEEMKSAESKLAQDGEMIKNGQVSTPVTFGVEDQRQMNLRNVSPQQLSPVLLEDAQTVSSVRAVESDFASVTRGVEEGCIARLEKSGVTLLLWRRSERDPQLIYGVQINGAMLLERAHDLVWVDEPLSREVCLALLDHGGKPVAQSAAGFVGNWRKPFVATEIGDVLPYWEAALYLIDPQRLTHSAQTLRWTLGGMVMLLVAVIAMGAGLVSREVAQRMHEARQKTDFVSNVSHELKTPLTSIRMFSELLAENRVQDPGRQKQYLNIIVSEAGRLTRLINNVLDFARMERGEKRYRMESVELGEQLREVAGMLSPNLQEQGLRLELDVPAETKFTLLADADALAQVWVNLICNAEKYAAAGKQISVRLERADGESAAPGRVRVVVEDRGPGVPRGLEKRIFEQFYRVDDSLAANVQGSGLGLTLARQIIEAHRGRIWYEPRPEGGSRFVVELPLI